MDLLKRIVYCTIEYPLRTLYMNGPSFREYGFWEGRNATHICAQLVHELEPEAWNEEISLQRRCDRLIERKFNAFYTMVVIGLYFYTFWNCLLLVLKRLLRRNKTPNRVSVS